jgi:hypothetical protein
MRLDGGNAIVILDGRRGWSEWEQQVDANEIREAVGEAVEERERRDERQESFRKGAAIFVGVMGMLLAIAALGGEWAMKDTINANIRASDTWAFYQARNIRQTSYQIASEELQMSLAANPTMPAEARDAIAKRIREYQALVARYESDPEKHEGKKELQAKARELEQEREVSQTKDLNFDFARAFYEIAIVLGSVSIVAASRALLWLCGGLAMVASALSANGFFNFFELPLH